MLGYTNVAFLITSNEIGSYNNIHSDITILRHIRVDSQSYIII